MHYDKTCIVGNSNNDEHTAFPAIDDVAAAEQEQHREQGDGKCHGGEVDVAYTFGTYWCDGCRCTHDEQYIEDVAAYHVSHCHVGIAFASCYDRCGQFGQ